jgi:hypothetical protein
MGGPPKTVRKSAAPMTLSRDWFDDFLDGVSVRANSVKPVARKKQTPELQLGPPRLFTLIGYAATWTPAKAGYPNCWGVHKLNRYTRGCFSDWLTFNDVFLARDHWDGVKYASTQKQTLRISQDDLGLYFEAVVTAPALIDAVHSGSHCGVSIMGIEQRACDIDGYRLHTQAGVEEISVVNHEEAGNRLCRCLIVELDEPKHLHDAAIANRTGWEQQRAAIVRRLLQRKRELAA